MQIEELYKMIGNLNISEIEKFNLRTIIKTAAYIYLTELNNEEVEDNINFTINDVKIENTPVLEALNIEVKPSTKTIVDSWDESRMITRESKTNVSFPRKLFSSETKKEVTQKVKTFKK